MIKPPSLVRDYDLVWSLDPALDAPVRSADETDASWQEREAEWQHKLTVARETGNYDPVLKPGQQPTVFHMRRIPALYWKRFQDDIASQRFGQFEAGTTIVRLALKAISNFGNVKVERQKDDDRYDGQLVKSDVLDTLAMFPGLLDELALGAFDRETQIPKG